MNPFLQKHSFLPFTRLSFFSYQRSSRVFDRTHAKIWFISLSHSLCPSLSLSSNSYKKSLLATLPLPCVNKRNYRERERLERWRNQRQSQRQGNPSDAKVNLKEQAVSKSNMRITDGVLTYTGENVTSRSGVQRTRAEADSGRSSGRLSGRLPGPPQNRLLVPLPQRSHFLAHGGLSALHFSLSLSLSPPPYPLSHSHLIHLSIHPPIFFIYLGYQSIHLCYL